MSCGQPLYRGKQRGPRKRIRAISLSLLGIAFVAVILLSTYKAREAKPPARSDANAPTDPVLTIVALDNRGEAMRQGSGFVLTSDGLAGSNLHVLRGAHDAVAQCCKSRKFLVGPVEAVDPDKDLILFQLYDSDTGIKPSGLPTVAISNSPVRSVGEKIVAIGSPQGLENTVSDGIVSAIRDYKLVRYLQITAPISPGSSGGPVLDSNGQMVGIATMQLRTGQNLNFAVDASQITPLLNQHLDISLAQLPSILRQTDETGSHPEPASDQTPARINPARIRGVNGWFAGEVHNTTVNLDAKFVIIVRDSDGLLSGCMAVFKPLAGSGPLQGIVDGDDISFDVTSQIGRIKFDGKRDADAITGTYLVDSAAQGTQQGSFALQQTTAKAPGADFDPSQCPSDDDLADTN